MAYGNVSASLIPPLFWDTRQANAITSQLPICNRPSDGQSSTKTTFALKDSLSRAIHITFGMSSSMHKPRDLSITAIRYPSVPDIQTQLNFEILSGDQNSFDLSSKRYN